MEVDQNSSFRVESGLRAMERTSKTCRRYTKRTVNYRQSYLDAIIVVFHRNLKKKKHHHQAVFGHYCLILITCPILDTSIPF